MPRTTPVQRTIAWLDHDEPSVNLVIRRIGDLKRTYVDMRRLNELYRFVPVLIQPPAVGQPSEEHAYRARDAIFEVCNGEPDLILVDLTFGSHESDAAVDNGRALALELLKLCDGIPVGVFTREELSSLNRYILTTDGFAVVLEWLRETLDSSNVRKKMTAEQWANVFEKVFAKAGKGISGQSLDVRLNADQLASQPSGSRERELVSPSVDIGIITIREDEMRAVLDLVQKRTTLYKKCIYELATVVSKSGRNVEVAITRCHGQGQAVAQLVTTHVILDLNPRWLFLVGIAGGLPSTEYSLGDVVVGTRVSDFAITARLEGESQVDLVGGPMHRDVEKFAAHLPSWVEDLGTWNDRGKLGQIPRVELSDDFGDPRYYGSDEWKRSVIKSLSANFGSGDRRLPLVTSRPIISSNTLVKDTELASEWRLCARSAAAVEMELGGVYVAARSIGDEECPIIAIRGISDIVGFKREPEWTGFACKSAAALAHAIVVNDVLPPRSNLARDKNA